MALIELKNIRKVYNHETLPLEVLKGMSFEIGEGEFVAIMGPSGSGKSTLLHIIGFLDSQTSGTCLFKGKGMNDYTEDEIAHIRNREMGFVFQAFNLLPRTSVYENVKLPLIYSNRPESEWHEQIMKAVRTVGLEHRLEHESSELSGGEKQRVAIARALVNDAKVIFADEPTGNLDSKSGAMIMKTLQKLNQEYGYTIVLITHETYTAEHAQRIIKIIDGQIESDRKVKTRHDANHGFKK